LSPISTPAVVQSLVW